jgi:hypothetical protein
LEPLLVHDHFDGTGLRTGENARHKEYNRIPRFVKTQVSGLGHGLLGITMPGFNPAGALTDYLRLRRGFLGRKS